MIKVAKATVCLHNYLQLTKNANYIPTEFVNSEDDNGAIIPGDWRNEIIENGGGAQTS